MLQVPRRHAVHAPGNITPGSNSGFDEGCFEVLAYIAWRRPVEREKAAFGANGDLTAGKPAPVQLAQRRANRSLTALAAIVRGRVNHVGAQLNGAHDRLSVTPISFFVCPAEVGANPN